MGCLYELYFDVACKGCNHVRVQSMYHRYLKTYGECESVHVLVPCGVSRLNVYIVFLSYIWNSSCYVFMVCMWRAFLHSKSRACGGVKG